MNKRLRQEIDMDDGKLDFERVMDMINWQNLCAGGRLCYGQ